MEYQSRNKIRAVLFDLDGVLVDSEGIYTDFWAAVDRQYPTGVENFAYVIKGTTLTEILGRYFPDSDIREKICLLLRKQENEMVYRLFDGIIPMLEELRRRGIMTAIVTSSNRRKMQSLFEAIPELEALTDTVVTDEDVTESKPSPQGYLLAARRLGVTPGEYAVVEDSLAGLRAGRAAGALVIGISTTNPVEKVSPLSDMVLSTAAELAEKI
ncbi:MAG: HAD family phosphatase [Muribaculaceae bacterium]|nr:HAD family phosphatase [Muribaculaceae bacterium]